MLDPVAHLQVPLVVGGVLAELLLVVGVEDGHVDLHRLQPRLVHRLEELGPAGDEELAGLPVALVPGVGHPGGGKVHHRQGCGLPHRPGTQQGQPPQGPEDVVDKGIVLGHHLVPLPAHRVEVALQLPGKGGQVPLLHQGGDALVGQVQGLEAGEQQDLLNLTLVVVAVAVPVVPMGGFQQALLVVVPQLLGGDVAEVGHLPHGVSGFLHPRAPFPPQPIWEAGATCMDYFYIVSQFRKKSILFSVAHKSFPWAEGFPWALQGCWDGRPKIAGFPAFLSPVSPGIPTGIPSFFPSACPGPVWKHSLTFPGREPLY